MRTSTVAALALLAVLWMAAPASGHPFGPPPTAELEADGQTVLVDWTANVDDMYSLGEQLGVLPEGTAEAFLEAATQVAPSAASERALARSPALTTYLLRNIRVEQDGRACDHSVAPPDDFVREGARVEAACPQPVATVDVSITMLTDVHPAYRTFAVGDHTAPPQNVYTTDQPTHRWTFGAVGEQAQRPLRVAMAVVAAGALVVLTSAAVRRRRR